MQLIECGLAECGQTECVNTECGQTECGSRERGLSECGPTEWHKLEAVIAQQIYNHGTVWESVLTQNRHNWLNEWTSLQMLQLHCKLLQQPQTGHFSHHRGDDWPPLCPLVSLIVSCLGAYSVLTQWMHTCWLNCQRCANGTRAMQLILLSMVVTETHPTPSGNQFYQPFRHPVICLSGTDWLIGGKLKGPFPVEDCKAEVCKIGLLEPQGMYHVSNHRVWLFINSNM